jgi:hypothetical protein
VSRCMGVRCACAWACERKCWGVKMHAHGNCTLRTQTRRPARCAVIPSTRLFLRLRWLHGAAHPHSQQRRGKLERLESGALSPPRHKLLARIKGLHQCLQAARVRAFC